ncbi:MAG: spore cortex-lytic protein [Ruminococcaceae bacterium]|nr:spore cortex-lytic protein [Oscillospiraceae bacterium]
MNNGSVNLPYIPETITVHLGSPSSNAPNVTLPFADYIKNVASSEIYPTWPEAALRANILAQISFALNRVYTEYYRSRGYPFDITNSTGIDQSFVQNRDIFENISRIVDDIFDSYLRRQGNVEPLFAAYCDGVEVQCPGLSQWGSVSLANQGFTPYEILTYYFGNDIDIVRNVPVQGLEESYPGIALRMGTSGNEVRTLQLRLNRIGRNYPSIPVITNPDGIFDGQTEAAVREFQRIFSLTPDGIVGRATWYAVARIYAAVKQLSELRSEGISLEDVTDLQDVELNEGDAGIGVRELQYFLRFIGFFNNEVPPVQIDGVFGERTRQSLEAFQRSYGLPVSGTVDTVTWVTLFRAYRGILDSLPEGYFSVVAEPFPGFPLRRGSEGEEVRTIQTYLNFISGTYPSIPRLRVDGIFGSGTDEAVREYQQLFGLPVSGIVGASTWNSIAGTYQNLYEQQMG